MRRLLSYDDRGEGGSERVAGSVVSKSGVVATTVRE